MLGARLTRVVLALLLAGLDAHGAEALPKVADAKPGTVVELPAGTFAGPAVLPPGVSLRGAGYAKTVIDARNQPVAIAVKGGMGARIEDLSILSGGTAIAVTSATDIAIRRVMIHGGTAAVQMSDVTAGRVENLIATQCMIGVSLNRVRKTAVANCTLDSCDAAALSVANSADVALFNNLAVNAGTGIVVAGANPRLAVDCNLYLALSVGKTDGQLPRPTIPTWRDVSGGLDAHSVQLNVTFANPAQNDFRPVSTLPWNPARVSTADWGVAELAGFKAPERDMDGQKRVGAPDLGAYEAPELPSRPFDGEFRVASGDGIASAGLFTPDGALVRYLFQGLPLRRGTHGFVLPSRDTFGRPIPPGRYELRLAESALNWSYRMPASNAGADNTFENADSVHNAYVAFTPDGSLLTASGWSERHINLRLGDLKTGKAKWVFRGSADSNGLCLDAEGKIYLMRGNGQGDFDLYKLDATTGHPIPRPDGTLLANFKGTLKSKYLGGIAELGGKLYVADPDADRVLFGPAVTLTLDASFGLAKPSCPTADRKRGLLWLVSARQKIVAVGPDGKLSHELADVKAPLALAIAGDRLAAASAETGKIHVFDIADPARPKPIRTVGRGDGPFGKWLPDRFHFQAHRFNAPNPHVSLALHEDGTLALRDSTARIVVFGPDEKVTHSGFAQWGGDPRIAPFAGDTAARCFGPSGAQSWFVDPKGNRWQPDAFWGLPPMSSPSLRGFFNAKGRNFGVFTCANPKERGDEWVMILSYDAPVAKPLALYRREAKKGYIVCRDTNGDGVMDEKDEPGKPLLDTEGRQVAYSLSGRFMFVDADGTIYHSGPQSVQVPQIATIWRFKGLDGQGVPIYEFTKDAFFTIRNPIVPSPYDLSKTENLRRASAMKLLPDGGCCVGIDLRTSPRGMGFSNSGATDLIRWNRDGALRWIRLLNDYSPIQGIEPVGSLILSSWGHQAEFMALDEDGLELGCFGLPAAAHWSGFWVDHPTEWFAFTGNDGNTHVLIGDYTTNCHHWLTLRDTASIRKSRVRVTISERTARELAYLPPAAHRMLAQPRPPEITIRRLPGPLKLEGSLDAWRRLNFPPQILLTPQNAYGQIRDALDLSGVIRLAYHGKDLYGQVIVFDDVITMHQPLSRFYQADSLQFCINGFMNGFGFSLAKTTDEGLVFFRNRFYFQKLNLNLDPAKAPRTLRVFDTAKDISERKYIEDIYGVDLSKSPAYVLEFKLPLDETTYKDDPRIIPQAEPGKWFWLGFMLNDNDTPGADVQNYIAWPGTFGMFAQPESGAKAYFE